MSEATIVVVEDDAHIADRERADGTGRRAGGAAAGGGGTRLQSRSITVGTDSTAQGVSVWVGDDGPGIPVDDIPHVFEPFWRSSRSPARDVGTGLGLAMLMAAMGGAVTAEPLQTGGTTTVVSLRPWHMATRGA